MLHYRQSSMLWHRNGNNNQPYIPQLTRKNQSFSLNFLDFNLAYIWNLNQFLLLAGARKMTGPSLKTSTVAKNLTFVYPLASRRIRRVSSCTWICFLQVLSYSCKEMELIWRPETFWSWASIWVKSKYKAYWAMRHSKCQEKKRGKIM
jgi:hypothetical protein